MLDLESQDLLDHVLFVFQEKGRWGSIARSRDIGLHGRKPCSDRLEISFGVTLILTSTSPGRIQGYGVTSLYNLGNYDWRFSPRKMTKIEDHLRAMPHKRLRSSDKRYENTPGALSQVQEEIPSPIPKLLCE
jgi:hypothetical protein